MTIHFQKMGEGQPLLLIHGLFGTSDNLKAIAKALADSFTIYLLDAPSHGNSATMNPLNYQSMAKAIIDFTEEQALANFSILGHSMGGKIAMEIALTQPDKVLKLIVADIAPVNYPRRHDEIIKALTTVPLDTLENRQQADKHLANFIPEPGVRGFLLKSLERGQEAAWQWKFALRDIAENYNNIISANTLALFDNPTLFLIGGNSDYVKPEYQNEITSRFPQAQAKVIQGAGHWLHAEKPAAFVKICRDFLLP